MDKITYVTGNFGKYTSVKERFEELGIEIDFFDYDFNEPEVNDIEFVSREKAIEAYKVLGKPCFVADSGFYIDNYPNNPGYPGAFVKRSGVSSNINNLLDIMSDIDDRSCYFLDCLTFYDGRDFYTFYGKSSGVLSREIKGNSIKKSWSNLWLVFIPNNCSKTLSEMDDIERKERNDGRTSAIEEFGNWYKEIYSKHKEKILKL